MESKLIFGIIKENTHPSGSKMSIPHPGKSSYPDLQNVDGTVSGKKLDKVLLNY